MDSRRHLPFLVVAVVWGAFVTALILYLFFPYQKVLKIALQNAVGGSRTMIAMEGVKSKTFGIKAAKVLFRPDANNGQTAPFELSDVDISWRPLSLLAGNLAIDSKASLYDGSLQSTVRGLAVTGSPTPSIVLTLRGLNMAKCPEGAFPWFKGMTGILDGTINKEKFFAAPGRQGGSFRFTIRNGDVKDLHVSNLPRLVIPYKEIVIEGTTDGARTDVSKISLRSDAVMLHGSGRIESLDAEQSLDINLSYEALVKTFPLKGKGAIAIRGTYSAPLVSISGDGPDKAPESRKSL